MRRPGIRRQMPALGALELSVMEQLWSTHEADAKSVHEALAPAQDRTLSTVQSALNRLHRKGLLSRFRVGHAYVYAPQTSRQQLIGQALQDMLRTLGGGSVAPLLSGFIDLADRTDLVTLTNLESLVSALREQQQASQAGTQP